MLKRKLEDVSTPISGLESAECFVKDSIGHI